MRYKTVANRETSIDVSVIGLGGHEFLPDGRFRGFNDNFELATQPGYIFEGFGKAERHVLPTAARDGIAFIAREPFMKGALFKMGEEAGYSDKGLLARTALSWCLSFEEITSVVMGVSNEQQLLDNLTVLASPGANEEENAIIEALKQTEAYNTYFNEKQNAFFA